MFFTAWSFKWQVHVFAGRVKILKSPVVIRTEIYKMLVRIANNEDPDQIASSDVVWSESASFAR